MEFIGRMITRFFNLLVLPFGTTHHTLGLVWLSLLTGVVMAFVFKWTSNPAAIRRAKERLKGRILEMRIYQDDPLLIVKGFGGTLKANGVYLGALIVPFLVLIIPVMIVFMQMDERYARRPLEEGATTLLSVQLKSGHDPFTTPVTLAVSDGVALDARPVRIAETREVDYRLRVASPGTHEVYLTADEQTYTVPIVAGPAFRMIGHERTASSFMEPLLHPALPALPGASPFHQIRVRYAGARYPFLTWHLHWILIFVIYSALSAIALKFVIKFEI